MANECLVYEYGGGLNQQIGEEWGGFQGSESSDPPNSSMGMFTQLSVLPKSNNRLPTSTWKKQCWTFLCNRKIQVQTTLRVIPPHNSFNTYYSACQRDNVKEGI